MKLTSANDNCPARLLALSPGHTGFQHDWMKDGCLTKSLQFYENYLINKLKRGQNA